MTDDAPTGDRDHHEIVGTLTRFLADQALPLWGGRGWDAANGGFIDRLDLSGAPLVDAPRRVFVQARQIYCFATAARLGWFPGGRDIALRGLEHLLATAKSPDGRPGYVHKLTAQGAVLDPQRDTYDHAFILLALATAYRLDRDAGILAEIVSLMEFIDESLTSRDGGFLEASPPRLPRRQNPQMHMLESLIAAYDATGDVGFQTRAGQLFGLFVANLFDARTQVLGEYFEEDWSAIRPVRVEPGHLAEWVYLLKAFERITRCPTARHRSLLLASALRYRDPATGCLVDEGDADGQITRSTMRCWPQTEIAKAWIVQAEGGDPGANDEARSALVRLHRRYLSHPVAGGWYDQFDSDGRSLVDFIPASSMYHIVSATAEAERVLA